MVDKMSKIEKDEDQADESFGSVKITSEVIFRSNLNFQIFNAAVITADGSILEASINGNSETSKIFMVAQNCQK